MTRQHRWLLLALVGLNLAAFGGSLRYGFVWDDNSLIVGNPLVSGPHGYLAIFSHDMTWMGGSPDRIHSLWRPLTLSFYRFFLHGLGEQPLPLHAANVAMHTVNAALVFVLLGRFVAAWPAFAGAAFFSLHPLRVESVDWISGFGDVLCAFFLLVAFLAFLSSLDSTRLLPAAIGLVAFAAALLSKEVAFVFPLLLFIVALPQGRWRPALPYLALAVITAVIRSRFTEAQLLGDLSWYQRALTSVVLFARYLYAMLLAGPQVLRLDFEPARAASDVRFLASAGALLAAAACARAWLPRLAWPPLAWMLLAIAPVCVIGISSTIYAERYTYLPSIGLVAALAIAGGTIAERCGAGRRLLRRVAAVVILVAAVASAAVSAQRGQVWKDDHALATAMLRQNPSDKLALYNLGLEYGKQGRLREARDCFERVLRIDPGIRSALVELGKIADAEGREQEALDYYYRAAVAGSPEGLLEIARIHRELGRDDDAETTLTQLLALYPDNAAALSALGDLAAARGDPDTAESYYERAVAIDPGHGGALNSLGILRQMSGDERSAYDYFRRAIDADATNTEALHNLAVSADRLGRCRSARDAYARFADLADQALATARKRARQRVAELERRMQANDCP